MAVRFNVQDFDEVRRALIGLQGQLDALGGGGGGGGGILPPTYVRCDGLASLTADWPAGDAFVISAGGLRNTADRGGAAGAVTLANVFLSCR